MPVQVGVVLREPCALEAVPESPRRTAFQAEPGKNCRLSASCRKVESKGLVAA